MGKQEGDYAAVVRANHQKTIAFLFADREPCARMRDDEIDRIARDLRPMDPGDLGNFHPPVSWLLAVILCPDTDLTQLSAWAARLGPAELDRIRFYAHPQTDIVAVLAPWYDAGLPDPPFHRVDDWKRLHPPFGRDLNDRVYRDWKDAG